MRGAVSWKTTISLLREAASNWHQDQAPRLGAALAYYAVFSISPLVIIALAIAGLWFRNEQGSSSQELAFAEINRVIGKAGTDAIQAILANASEPKAGMVATFVAAMTLLFGAAGIFIQLKDAMNTIWHVKQLHGGIARFIRTRIFSFLMVGMIGLLLLAAVALNIGLSALSSQRWAHSPGLAILWQTLNFLVSLILVSIFFAAIFKILPDEKVDWRDVWHGAILTGVLFSIGKHILGFYLANNSTASAFGAAGSLVVILIWVYYSSQILFFGAEFTRAYAYRFGSHTRSDTGFEKRAFGRNESISPSSQRPDRPKSLVAYKTS